MKRSRRWPLFAAIACAGGAAFDFTAAIVTAASVDYILGGAMVAGVFLNLFLARQRKADSAMSSNSNSSDFAVGGYISGPLSLSFSTTPPATRPSPPAKVPQEFHGVPFDFTVGEVYGMRMWYMDKYGRLRARNWNGAAPWRPGLNMATCVPKADEDYLSSFMRAAGLATPPSAKQAPKPPHETPSENCACGFYAYTDSLHAETKPYTTGDGEEVLLGIIRGTGRTLIGTKGFRCEKAEIVALRDPTRGGTRTDPWRLRQLANLKRVYPDVPLLPSREALVEFAPLTNTLPDPSTNEFWSLP